MPYLLDVEKTLANLTSHPNFKRSFPNAEPEVIEAYREFLTVLPSYLGPELLRQLPTNRNGRALVLASIRTSLITSLMESVARYSTADAAAEDVVAEVRRDLRRMSENARGLEDASDGAFGPNDANSMDWVCVIDEDREISAPAGFTDRIRAGAVTCRELIETVPIMFAPVPSTDDVIIEDSDDGYGFTIR